MKRPNTTSLSALRESIVYDEQLVQTKIVKKGDFVIKLLTFYKG